MRLKLALQTPADQELGTLIARLFDFGLSPDEQRRTRELVAEIFGAHAEPILRASATAAAARQAAEALRLELEKQRQSAQLSGIVIRVARERVHVLIAGTERLLLRDGIDVGVGQRVITDADGRRVLACGDYLVGGQTFSMCEHLDGRRVLLQPLRESPEADARVTALVSDAIDLATLLPGDRVLAWTLDGGNLVLVTHRLGALRPAAIDDGGAGREVAREDLIGLGSILERLDRLFLDVPTPAYAPLLDQVARGVVGAVLQGPPGCAKTLVAEYVASLVRARGGTALYRTASHYLSKWVGQGAGILRTDFSLLEESYAKTGVRPLLVIDELEAIALDRSHGWTLRGGHLDVLDTLLSRLTRTSVRVIGISNVADRFLDSALVRAGRLPVIAFPPTLDAEQVTALVARMLANVPLAKEVS